MSEMVWDDTQQRYISTKELERKKLKDEILNDLINTLLGNIQIVVQIDPTSGKGQGQFKKVQQT